MKPRVRVVGKKGKWTFRKVVTRTMGEDIRAERARLAREDKENGQEKKYLAYVQTAITNVVNEVSAVEATKAEIEAKVTRWNERPPLKILIA